VPFEYTYISDFADGLAMVERDRRWGGTHGRWGVIDRNGVEAVPAVNVWATPFNSYGSNGSSGLIGRLAAVSNDGAWEILQIRSYSRHARVTFGATQYILNGSWFTEPAIVYNGVAYLPAAYLARRLGIRAEWDRETNTTALTSDAFTPSLVTGPLPEHNPVARRIWAGFGSTRYYLDGVAFTEPSLVYDGVAYLPAAYLARKLGLTATWDAATNITELTSDN